jgi:guanylate kinase
MTAMNDPGLLIVVSGPSGAGKGTICDALRQRHPSIKYSISMTTRAARKGEKDGINYFFTNNQHFEELLAEDAFLEHAKVYDHYYGTPKKYVFDQLQQGNHVMLEIDIQGAMQVKERYPKGIFIYIVPPSLAVLENRLRTRGTDSDDVIKSRLAKVRDELKWIDKYDYVIINDSLEKAIEQADAVFTAEQDKITRSTYKISSIIDNYKK